jgi:hypothetical protein
MSLFTESVDFIGVCFDGSGRPLGEAAAPTEPDASGWPSSTSTDADVKVALLIHVTFLRRAAS